MAEEEKVEQNNLDVPVGQSETTSETTEQSDQTSIKTEEDMDIGQLLKDAQAEETGKKDRWGDKTKEDVIDAYDNLQSRTFSEIDKLKNEMKEFREDRAIPPGQSFTQIPQPPQAPKITAGMLREAMEDNPEKDITELLAPTIDAKVQEKLLPLYQRDTQRAERVAKSYLQEWNKENIPISRNEFDGIVQRLTGATEPEDICEIVRDIYLGKNLPNAIKQARVKRESLVAEKQAAATGTFTGGVGASNIDTSGKPLTPTEKDKVGAQQFLGKVR